MAAAFTQAHPGQVFKDHHTLSLSGSMRFRAGSRHEHLIQRLSAGPVIGLYMPALTEYSLPAAVERLATLPTDWLLAGGIDTAAALIAEPALLVRKQGYAPLLWTAGLETKPGEGHCFEAYGYDMTFNRRKHFDACAETSTCALVVLA